MFFIIIASLGAVLLVFFLMPGPSRIVVAISTSVRSGSNQGSSEINTFELFLRRHPESPIQIRVVHDEWTPKTARDKILAAQKEGVSYFITSHPSSVALAVMDLFEDGKALAMVTASTTEKLSGRDDYSFRVVCDLIAEQQDLADYVGKLPGKRLLIIRDSGNPPYTEPAARYFLERLKRYPDKSVREVSTRVADFDRYVLEKALKEPYDMLYILAGSYQTVVGNIAQLSEQTNPRAPIILTPWVRTPALVGTAGTALPLMVMASEYPSRYEEPAYDDFFKGFKTAFGYEPTSMSIGVYQSLEILHEAFSKGFVTPSKVKSYLLQKKTFNTALGSIRFDEYGDRRTAFYYISDLTREFQ